MRILERAIVLVLLMTALPMAGTATGRVDSGATQVVLEQGLKAYRAGKLSVAIPALESAASHDSREGFLAQFYLARIYSDNSHPLTDHPKAYVLYQRIADAYADIDPDDDQRAPFVAKALVALAGYLRQGVADIGLKADVERAAQYLHHAATFFADEDAQFELAKLFLTGDGIAPDVRRAVHWFSVLSQRGHPGAQAFLADLYWRGRHVQKNAERALALATLAAEGAPSNERIWIEDVYHRIYCGTSEGQRSDAGGVVADWRQKYGRAPEPERSTGQWTTPTRACDDGRIVPVPASNPQGSEGGARVVGPELPAAKADLATVAPATTLIEIGSRPVRNP